MTGTEITFMVAFTAACAYFNWRGGYRHGFVSGGSQVYDVAVADTVSYLVKNSNLSPQKVNQEFIEAIVSQGIKDRNLVEQMEKAEQG